MARYRFHCTNGSDCVFDAKGTDIRVPGSPCGPSAAGGPRGDALACGSGGLVGLAGDSVRPPGAACVASAVYVPAAEDLGLMVCLDQPECARSRSGEGAHGFTFHPQPIVPQTPPNPKFYT